jgi:DNA (cytosine-5)-methyltransferase 1
MGSAALAPLVYAAKPTAPVANDQDDLIIDLFAGGGGASEAIVMATGRHPDLAVNHNQEAVDLHRANHPTTLHLCEDIRKVDPVAVLTKNWPGRRVGLMWASPDCRHHSKASGGTLKDRGIRGLAWEVVRWCVAIKKATGAFPSLIALENVEEFADWGPIHRYGRKAGRVNKRRRGETFRIWREQFERLGAIVERKELVAADYGAPTTRKRLFVIISFVGKPAWPEPTHGKVASTGDLFNRALKPWRAAAEIIDWSLPCPSIFTRKKALAPKTHRRIAKGLKRFVIEASRPFIVPLTHAGERKVYSTDEPLPTITAAHRGELAAVAPHLTEMANWSRDGDRSVETPLPTVTAKPDGGSFAVVSAHITKFHDASAGADAASPLPTVTANSFHKRPGGAVPLGVAAAHIIRTDMQSSAPRTGVHGADEPIRTITAGGGFAAVQTTLGGASIGVGGRAGQSPPRGLDEPVNTVTAKADRAITVAHLQRQFGTTTGQDLYRPHPTVMTDGAGGKSQLVTAHLGRMAKGSVGSDPADPALTTTAKSKDAIVAPILDKYYETGVAQEVDRPLDTITAKGRFGLAGAFIEQANTGVIGHRPEDPISTLTAAGSQQRVIEAELEAIGAPMGSKRRAVLEFLWEHFGEPSESEWADPLASPQGRLRFGLVVIDDICWQIVDIGMRMLVPRELYGAQGFPADYIIDVTWEGKPLTKTAQTRMAGNSVSPPPAAALLTVNLPDKMLRRMAA